MQLKPALHLKKVEVTKDLSELAVKSRSARGNVLTKYEVKSITLKQKGHSTLGGRKVWFDPDVLRINYDAQGTYLGEFWDEDRILVITTTGDYYLTTFELTAHFGQNILRIEKFNADKVWSLAMWNADLGYYYGKRFQLDAQPKSQNMLGDNSSSRIMLLTDREEAAFRLVFTDETKPDMDIIMSDFIDVKSPKAKGKRFSTLDITRIEDITPVHEPAPSEDSNENDNPSAENDNPSEESHNTPEDTPAPAEISTPLDNAAGVPFTITNEVPEDSRPIDEQLSLF